MPGYVCSLTDGVFVMAFLQSWTITMAVYFMALKHRYQQEDNDLGGERPSYRIAYGLEVSGPDFLTNVERARVARMVQDGEGLSFRSAARAGFTRAQWAAVRRRLHEMGFGEVDMRGGFVMRDEIYRYLGLPQPEMDIKNVQNVRQYTTQHDTREGWGRGVV